MPLTNNIINEVNPRIGNSRYSLSNINLGNFALALGVGVCAILFGLLATTANPIMIGLAVGLVGGVFLLTMPKNIIWLVLSLGLSTGALLSLAGPGFDKISWAISMMAFLLWLPSLMQLLRRHDIPLFVWLALIFVVMAIVSTVLEWHSASQFVTGFKRYFQMYGLLLAFAIFAITKQDFDRWLKLLLGIAILQLPFAIYERFVLVPMRSGMNIGEATDIVAGTMGANLVGGSPNSVMALFVLLAFAFVLMRWRTGLLTTWKMALLGLLLLAPLTLGETKVVVIMMPLIGLVLLRKDFIKNPMRYFPVLLALVMVTIAMAYVYVEIVLESTFADVIKASMQYNVGSQGYSRFTYLNRMTVVSFWWTQQGLHDPLGFIFGHGLGSSFGSAGNAGHIAMQYPNAGIGLTTVSTLLWDVGIIGFALYLSVFIVAWREASNLWKHTKNSVVKADLLVIQAAIALFIMLMAYSDSQINLISMEIIMATIFGYLAFLIRQHATKPALQARLI